MLMGGPSGCGILKVHGPVVHRETFVNARFKLTYAEDLLNVPGLSAIRLDGERLVGSVRQMAANASVEFEEVP